MCHCKCVRHLYLVLLFATTFVAAAVFSSDSPVWDRAYMSGTVRMILAMSMILANYYCNYYCYIFLYFYSVLPLVVKIIRVKNNRLKTMSGEVTTVQCVAHLEMSPVKRLCYRAGSKWKREVNCLRSSKVDDTQRSSSIQLSTIRR